jgi:hypothetical protein
MRLISILAATGLVCLLSVAAYGQDVYFEDFEDTGAALSEWSSTTTSVTPTDSRRFLGDFGNQTVTLSLEDLPSHDKLVVAFDLFILRSWDGDGDQADPPGSGTPDLWSIAVDGVEVFETTFKQGTSNSQAFPVDVDKGEAYPGETAAVEVNTLGYTDHGHDADAVYFR